MCLGVPGKVVEIDGNLATVEFWGLHRQVRLDIVDEAVAVGDFVLNHVGFAIRRIPASEAEATLALYDELLTGDDDLMSGDVRSEIRASGGAPAAARAASPAGDRNGGPAQPADRPALLEAGAACLLLPRPAAPGSSRRKAR